MTPRPLAVLLGLLLTACADGDYATLTIQYKARSAADAWSTEPSARQRILEAFKRTAEAQGYKCNERGKRIGDITCAGPKRMNVTFEPDLREREYIVHFNWVEWHGRTREEFDAHVEKFATAMTAAVPDAKVVVTHGREAP